MRLSLVLFVALLGMCVSSSAHAVHALSLFDAPKYPPYFGHFSYVNPEAPKGGKVNLYYPAPFDSLNPFVLKGMAAPLANVLLHDSLMTPSLDEAQTYYPLIARDVDLAANRLSMSFLLNKRARFHDGTPITAEDVAFSLKLLQEKGHPAYQLRYKQVKSVHVFGKHNIIFHFSSNENRDLPFFVAAMPIFSKAYYQDRDFASKTMEIPLGSGPYRVKKAQAGRFITYERAPHYWANDLPSRKGMYNFDELRFDVYRDETVALEAFKAQEYDFREEYMARSWAEGYNFPAVARGEVKKDMSPHKMPRGMQGFIYNMRREKFKDRRVREAIALTFDFEWMNRTLFYNSYSRNRSFFQNTPFAATGIPSKEEVAFLEPYRDTLPPDLFTTPFEVPVSDGSGFIRDRLIKADKLLKAAGWIIRDGVRVHQETGTPLTIEFLARQRSLERVTMVMQRNLDILGITANYRLVDESQYQKRTETYDFDISTIWWNMGVVFPGYEQYGFWHCSQVGIEGGQNLAGFCNPAVDKLVDKISHARTKQDLEFSARALDRILLHEHVVIPHFSLYNFRLAYWDKFGIPTIRPDYDNGFFTWWVK